MSEGDFVSICSLNTPESIELIYAINRIGAVANLATPFMDGDTLRECLSKRSCRIAFVLDVFFDGFKDFIMGSPVETVVVMSTTRSMSLFNRVGARLVKGMKSPRLPDKGKAISWESFLRLGSSVPPIAGSGSDIALVCYTSGSTGTQKGVCLSNNAVNSTAEQYLISGADVKRGQTWLNYIPVFVAFGMIASIHLSLLGGVTCINRISGSERLSGGLKRYRPNHVIHGPRYWLEVADDNLSIDLSCLIEPTTGGDRLTGAEENRINEYLANMGSRHSLMNGYGMTETAAGVSLNSPLANKQGSVGIPLCKNIIAAFDTSTGEEMKYGEEGEICVLTPSSMCGYLDSGKETEEVLRVHADGQTWVHTGDYGYVDADGFVFLSGRMKRFYLYSRPGSVRKVYCLEVEQVLMLSDKVESCAVVATDSPETLQAPVAFIKKKSSCNCSEDKLEGELRQAFLGRDESLRPERYCFIDEFPFTDVGKIDHFKLEELAAQ